MGGLTSPKTYAALAAFQAVDAVACAIPVAPVAKALDTLRIPQDIRWLLPASRMPMELICRMWERHRQQPAAQPK